MYRFLIYILVVCFFSNTIQSQNLDVSALIDYKKSSYRTTNYNGPIKSSYWYFTYVSDSLALEGDDGYKKIIKDAVMFHNRDIGGALYREFDEKGRIALVLARNKNSTDYRKNELNTTSAKTITVYDDKDWERKLSFKIKNRQKYPVQDYDILVKPNFITYDGISDFALKSIFIYKKDINNRIISEELFFNETLPYTKNEFLYDKKGNVTRINIVTKEEKPIPYHFLDTETGFCPDLHISYEYDNKNQITQITYFGCNDILAFEKYEYHPEKEYVSKRTRYIESSTRAFTHVTKTMIFYYNENGDVIAKEYVKSRPEAKIYLGAYLFLEPKIYYTYEYDKYNNWIKCYVYMEGKPENSKPTLIAERELTYYEN